MDNTTERIQSLNFSDHEKENQPEPEATTSSANDPHTENFEERGRPEDHWGDLKHDCPVCGTWRMFCPGCGSTGYAFPCHHLDAN